MQQLFRHPLLALYMGSGVCFVGLLSGCGGERNSADAPDSDSLRGSQTVPAIHRGGDASAAIRPIADSAAARAGSETQAQRLLSQMLTHYRRARSYADQGTVQLSYRQNGVPQTDTAPLAVRYEAPGRLSLQAYGLQLACHAGILSAQILDEASANLDGQRLQQPLGDERLSLDALYADGIVTQFATAGLGGPAPQLELLFGDTPLSGLLAEESQLSLDSPARLDSHTCNRLRIATPPLHYVLWIDQQDLTLRRIELPLALVPGLVDDVTIHDAKLTIELTAATFDPPQPGRFELEPRRGARLVSRFVPLPPPLDSPLLGRTPPPFVLESRAANGAGFRITEAGSDRKVTVLLWVARHEGSQAAASELQELAGAMPTSLRESTRFVIVMAEAGGPTDQTLQSWGVDLPWVNDTQAIGRDVFGVEEAPTLCVLSSRRQIEWYQHRVEPGAMLALPQVIADLMAGARVGETLQADHAANQQAYQDAIQEAAP